MKRVLILGGSYFIGRSIAEDLMAHECEVTLLNRGSKLVEGTNQITCDRDNARELREALAGKEFDYLVDVSGLTQAQVKAVCEAVELETLQGVVFISSSAVYDVEHLQGRFREEDKVRKNKFWGQYGTDKIAAERTYTEALSKAGIPLTILRPPYVYGEHNYVQRESFMFEHILMGKSVLLPKGDPKLQFIYVRDLAEVVRKVLETPQEGCNIYNVGNEACVTAREWVKLCAQAAGRKVELVTFDYKKAGIGVREFFPFADYNNVLNVDKVKKLCPTETAMLEGLKKAFAWYLQERDNITMKETVKQKETEILTMLEI